MNLDSERLYFVKLAVMAGFKLLIKRWSWLSFLLGPAGRIISIPFEMLISELVIFGVLKIDSKYILNGIEFDEKELDEGMRRTLKAVKGKVLSESEKQKHRDAVMVLAANFAAYNKRMRSLKASNKTT